MGAKELKIENIEWKINGIKPFSLKFSKSFIVSKNDRITKHQYNKKESFRAWKLPSLRAFLESCETVQELKALLALSPKELPKIVLSSEASRLYALSFDEGGVNMWFKTRLKFPMK